MFVSYGFQISVTDRLERTTRLAERRHEESLSIEVTQRKSFAIFHHENLFPQTRTVTH